MNNIVKDLTEFSSNKNKAFLWNLMLEANLFNNIPSSNIDNVKQVFESHITNILNHSENHSTLIMMNKRLMREIVNDLERFRISNEVFLNDRNSNKLLNTNQELSRNKQEQLNNALKTHKQDFENMINIKKTVRH